MLTALLLPDPLRSQIEAEALQQFPRECCGLIEGFFFDDTLHAAALHAARNVSHADNRFDIDSADHFRALRSARSKGRAIVGCYHSHPSGNAEPSQHDRDRAQDAGFVWLICATSPPKTQMAAFVFDKAGFRALKLASSSAA
jgi:proteasome lid subunit RPN8/RPN11